MIQRIERFQCKNFHMFATKSEIYLKKIFRKQKNFAQKLGEAHDLIRQWMYSVSVWLSLCVENEEFTA